MGPLWLGEQRGNRGFLYFFARFTVCCLVIVFVTAWETRRIFMIQYRVHKGGWHPLSSLRQFWIMHLLNSAHLPYVILVGSTVGARVSSTKLLPKLFSPLTTTPATNRRRLTRRCHNTAHFASVPHPETHRTGSKLHREHLMYYAYTSY